MTEDQIKVQRFLGWHLPNNFRPDNGISYTPTQHDAATGSTPYGTNLFDADQADAMVRYLVEGLPGVPGDDPDFICEACGKAICKGDKYTSTLDGCYLCENDAPSYQEAVDHWAAHLPETDEESEAAEGCEKALADHVAAGGSPDDKPLTVME